jgi:ELWxxDGT repeat protein
LGNGRNPGRDERAGYGWAVRVATPDFTVLGGTTLFAGATTGGFGAIGLWVTDGTPAGTSELTVPGQAGGALDDLFVGGFDPNFTVLGSKAVFVGVDASVHTNLWVTDGTAAGTREISTPGAWSGGLFVNVSSPDFTVLGSKALFAGRDTSNDVNLWVTDGTPAGTRELVVAGAGTFGVFGGGNPPNPDFTVLGNKAVFVGNGALWVTDGTSAGTTQLTVSGADPRGVFFNGIFPDFAVLSGKALFDGSAANGFLSGLPSLWVTDGASAGTIALTVTGANSGGLFSSVNPIS